MLALIVFRTQNIEWIRGITLTPSRVLFVHNLDQGLLGILRPRFEDVSNIPIFISSLKVLRESSSGAKFVSDLIPSLGGRILEWVTYFSHEGDEAWQPSDDTVWHALNCWRDRIWCSLTVRGCVDPCTLPVR